MGDEDDGDDGDGGCEHNGSGNAPDNLPGNGSGSDNGGENRRDGHSAPWRGGPWSEQPPKKPRCAALSDLPWIPPFPFSASLGTSVQVSSHLPKSEYSSWGIEELSEDDTVHSAEVGFDKPIDDVEQLLTCSSSDGGPVSCGKLRRHVTFDLVPIMVEPPAIAVELDADASPFAMDDAFARFLEGCYLQYLSKNHAMYNYSFHHIMDINAREMILLLQFGVKELLGHSALGEDACGILTSHLQGRRPHFSSAERRLVWEWLGQRLQSSGSGLA